MEVGPPLAGALLALCLAPGIDGRMITASKHRGDLHATEVGRTGVVRMLQEDITVAFIHQ